MGRDEFSLQRSRQGEDGGYTCCPCKLSAARGRRRGEVHDVSVKRPGENCPPSVDTNSTAFISRSNRAETQCVTKGFGSRDALRAAVLHRGLDSSPSTGEDFPPDGACGQTMRSREESGCRLPCCTAVRLSVSQAVPCRAGNRLSCLASLCHVSSLRPVAGRCMHAFICVCACVSAAASCNPVAPPWI